MLVDPSTMTVSTEGLNVHGDWFETSLKGGLRQTNLSTDARLTGELKLDSALLAKRVEPMVGRRIELVGTYTGPLDIVAGIGENETTFDVRTAIGWESARPSGR